MIVDREEGYQSRVAHDWPGQGVRLLGVSVYDESSGLVRRPMTGYRNQWYERAVLVGASLVSWTRHLAYGGIARCRRGSYEGR